MERKTTTRPPTSAERHAARALGRPEPDEVEVDVTPSAAQHAARLAEVPQSAKPKNVQTFDWYARRSLGGVRADEPAREAAVEEEESRPLPGWAQRMVYRPGGGDAA
ncbi:hypothetical protein F7R91_05610 [Streptomyces luteolifulvus]|uniref:Uncharacterized protein n=1 Tax=Streptomyces luteolifulvus TaxID=2615112 RepID=A0A6H9V3C1_9ACTN|nr:hypothetical protein [Streptomyces luteolifulvus]KAB1149235.1 hypothetical protein F7R91_05610 [Streptomyces luteolifulvus]